MVDDDTSKIKEHYENIKAYKKEEREKLETIKIRMFNNFVKSVLIKEHVLPNQYVLDIGCGKGGDLLKYKAAKIFGYYGVDVSKNSIKEASERLKKCGIKFHAEFHEGDFYNKPVVLETSFDVISIQFSLHYAFSSYKSFKNTLRNISMHLKTGGVVIATIPDYDVLTNRLKKYGPKFGNTLYRVNFKRTYEEIISSGDRFGLEYIFTLKEAVEDCVEYMIDINALRLSLDDFGLEIIEKEGFIDFYNKKRKLHTDIFEKTIGDVILSEDDLAVVRLYSIIVIKKVSSFFF